MKIRNKVISLLLAVLLAFSIAPLSFAAFKKGSVISFGSYPQARVTDSILIGQLNEQNKTWKNYGYYSGTGERFDGAMQPQAYMEYADFTFRTVKYRAVRFYDYRPAYTGYSLDNDKLHTWQDDNGYARERIYYFKYSELKWIVLDADDGLIVCQNAIDAQPFQNVVLQRGDLYYQGSGFSAKLANDYAKSSLRKWLNEDFVKTAFTSSQKKNLKSVDSKDSSGATIYDNVFLLTKEQAQSLMTAANRKASATAYAKCQGAQVSTDSAVSGKARWWMRGETAETNASPAAAANGDLSGTSTVDGAMIGVRPAVKLATKVSDDDLCPLCGKRHTGSGAAITKMFHLFFYRIRMFFLRGA